MNTTSQQTILTEDAREMLCVAMGWERNMEEYLYHWATNRRKGSGDADAYFDDPNWEHVEDRFFRDEHTDNYCFRTKLPEPIQNGWIPPFAAPIPSERARCLLNPENVIADDFLVLEWMRSTDQNIKRFSPELWHWRYSDYQPGAWARIAVHVLRHSV